MAATASGTLYTTSTINLGEPHGVMHITAKDGLTGTRPCVLYAHGAGGASDQMVSLSSWSQMRDWIIDAGIVIIEGSGGSVQGAQNWGNPAARAAYPAYLAHARTLRSLGPVILIGRSMGGLVASWLYAHDTTNQYAGFINNSGVSTMFVGALSGSKDAAAATGWYFSPTIFNAWGATDVASLQIAASDAAPENFAQSMWSGKKMLSCYGDADTTVPWNVRGAGALQPSLTQLAVNRVSLTPGGAHGGSVNSYTDVAAMSAFISDVFGLTPPPPAPQVSYRTRNMYELVGGQIMKILK